MIEKEDIRNKIKRTLNEGRRIPEDSITVYTNGPFQKTENGRWMAQALLTQDVWENRDIREAFRSKADQQMTVDKMGQTYEITSWSENKSMAEGIQNRWLELEKKIKREAKLENGRVLWHGK